MEADPRVPPSPTRQKGERVCEGRVVLSSAAIHMPGLGLALVKGDTWRCSPHMKPQTCSRTWSQSHLLSVPFFK